MKNSKAIDMGVFLVSIGLIWMLVNLGIISWSIVNSLEVVWPLILVAIGVGIIFRHSAIIRNASWLLFLAVLITHSFYTAGGTVTQNNTDSAVVGTESAGSILNVEKESTDEDKDATDEDKDATDEDKDATDEDIDATVNHKVNSEDVKTVSEEKKAGIDKAELLLSMGACKINVDSNTDKMLEAELEDKSLIYDKEESGNSGEYVFESENKVINIIDNEKNVFNKNRNNSFHLNKDVLWELNVDTGAVDGTFDLANLAVEKLSMDVGMATVNLKFGDKVEKCEVDINSGFSKINIEVPSSAGVRVDMDGAFNSSDFSSSQWEKKDNGYYSKNYDSSDVKIDIGIDMGFGNLSFDFK